MSEYTSRRYYADFTKKRLTAIPALCKHTKFVFLFLRYDIDKHRQKQFNAHLVLIEKKLTRTATVVAPITIANIIVTISLAESNVTLGHHFVIRLNELN